MGQDIQRLVARHLAGPLQPTVQGKGQDPLVTVYQHVDHLRWGDVCSKRIYTCYIVIVTYYICNICVCVSNAAAMVLNCYDYERYEYIE